MFKFIFRSLSLSVDFQSLKNGIRILALNRPEAKNAINSQILTDISDCIQKLVQDESAHVVIIRSNVKGVFCAGADLKERLEMKLEDVEGHVSRIRCIFESLAQLPQVTIAAIDGTALGGGLELALACDMRIASNNAKMGLVEAKLGIIPGAGGTQRLPQILGIAKAKELIFRGTILNSEEALRIGLINQIAPDINIKTPVTSSKISENAPEYPAFAQSLSIAYQMMEEMSPLSLKHSKSAINKGFGKPFDLALMCEEEEYKKIIYKKDRIEGLNAFIQKRKPIYQ